MPPKILSSVVWSFFTIEEDNDSKAKCHLCNKIISRGSPGAPKKSFSTSSLRKHLIYQHPNEYNAAQDEIDIMKGVDPKNGWRNTTNTYNKIRKMKKQNNAEYDVKPKKWSLFDHHHFLEMPNYEGQSQHQSQYECETVHNEEETPVDVEIKVENHDVEDPLTFGPEESPAASKSHNGYDLESQTANSLSAYTGYGLSDSGHPQSENETFDEVPYEPVCDLTCEDTKNLNKTHHGGSYEAVKPLSSGIPINVKPVLDNVLYDPVGSLSSAIPKGVKANKDAGTDLTKSSKRKRSKKDNDKPHKNQKQQPENNYLITNKNESKYFYNDEDDTDIFFRSMSMTVKNFHPAFLIEAKKRICNVVMDLQLENEKFQAKTLPLQFQSLLDSFSLHASLPSSSLLNSQTLPSSSLLNSQTLSSSSLLNSQKN